MSSVPAASRAVGLTRISDEEFRFFENHRFVFVGAKPGDPAFRWIAWD